MTDTDEARRNLTMLESRALTGGLNVSDGHPRMPLTDTQRAIVDDLGAMFHETVKRPFEEVEQEAQRTFLHGIGQACAPIGTGRLVSCYSSSVAMDLVARTLAERGGRVALLCPTFDNIPDLLKARGIDLVPVTEHEVGQGLEALPADVRAVFVTTPNNPTGWVLDEPGLERLAARCADTGRVLALDTCFRAQDPRAQYDTYRILAESGTEWVVIEDTGKLWPVLELKAGFLAWGEGTRLALADAFSDVLLTMSPVILRLITRLAADAADGGYAELHALLARNRQHLAEALEGTPLSLADPDARISVARVALPEGGRTAEEFYRELLWRDMHILPCAPFHWDRTDEGEAYFRIALARSEPDVELAGRVLRDSALDLLEGARR